jgi:hypothetical protein
MTSMQAATASPCTDAWPPEVELILSALEAATPEHDERRRHQRLSFRVAAELRLFSDAPGIPTWRLYTRDISVRGMGFITQNRLPLGYGGVVQLPTPRTGRIVSVAGTLFRCREVSSGWFEGSLYFNREQWIFAPDQS